MIERHKRICKTCKKPFFIGNKNYYKNARECSLCKFRIKDEGEWPVVEIFRRVCPQCEITFETGVIDRELCQTCQNDYQREVYAYEIGKTLKKSLTLTNEYVTLSGVR